MILTTLNIFFWKHLKSIRFEWCSNLFNLFIPILLCVAQMHLFHVAQHSQQTTAFESIEYPDLNSNYPHNEDNLLLYAPNTTFNGKLIEQVRIKMGIIEDRIRVFPNELDLNDYMHSHQQGLRDYGVIFHNDELFPKNQLSRKLNYTIRTRNNNFFTNKLFMHNIFASTLSNSDEYCQSGFLALQFAIDDAFINLTTNVNNFFQIEFEKLPSNAHLGILFQGIIITAILAIILYTMSVTNLALVPLVEEKESGVKEFLRIASSYSYLNNVVLFIINFIIGLFILGTIFLTANSYKLTTHFSAATLIVLVILFLLSMIAYTFLISVIFNSVFFAKSGGILFFIIPLSIMLSDKTAFLYPLFNTLVVYKGFSIFDEYGRRGLVFTMSNIFENIIDNEYSMATIYLILLLNTIGYLVLYYYLVQVYPGPFGTPRPIYFPFQPSFYCRNKIMTNNCDVGDGIAVDAGDSDTSNLNNDDIVVKIRGLTKEFGYLCTKSKMAVNNLSMNIYKNQITVLLGHNGAGKTTTMSMISGIIPKTSGTITVDGETNVHNYRHKIGYCPQHNIFMRYFTCLDHLLFFGGLRGLSCKKAKNQAQILLDKLHLTHKSKEFGKNLSGGMKRRLCLGNALIGNIQIAILDEPSSGLDPESRRELWNILLEMRKEQSILITTHYMEEAETLADKISIMSHGEILCHGTSMQLKRKYATGYVMKLLTNLPFNLSQFFKLIKKYVPDASVKSLVLPTVNVTLPYKYLDKFPDMLSDLERHAKEIGIESISMTNASLEEVFLNCDPQSVLPPSQDVTDEGDRFTYTQLGAGYIDPGKNFRIQRQQFMAIIYKKLLFIRAYWMYFLFSCGFPVLALFIAFRTINSNLVNSQFIPSNALDLNLNQIENSEAWLLRHTGNVNMEHLEKEIKNIANEQNVTINHFYEDDLLNSLLQIEHNNKTFYHERFSALEFSSGVDDRFIKIKIYFSGNSYHSSAMLLNFVENAILRTLSGGSGSTTINSDQQNLLAPSSKISIHTFNEPLQKTKTLLTKSDLDIYLVLMPFSIFLYILFYLYLPFAEESSEFKKLQSISPGLYWFAYYLFDLVVHCFVCVILLLLHKAFDTQQLFGSTEYTIIVTIYLFYGLAYLPLSYIICQMFSTLSSLYSFFTYMFVIANLAAQFISGSSDTMNKYSGWLAVCMIFPDYALRHAFTAMFLVFTESQTLKSFTQNNAQYLIDAASYTTPGVLDIRRYYIYMSIVSLFLMLFLIIIWENIYRKEKIITTGKMFKNMGCIKKKKKIKSKSLGSNNGGDGVDGGGGGGVQEDVDCVDGIGSSRNGGLNNAISDVVKENDITDSVVENNEIDKFAIVASKLEKQFDDFKAVRGVSFTVKRGECFGLLGMNGAGKTTTFKMMTRDLTITKGDIYFNGINSIKNPTQYKFMFGYCPQNDALNDYMTAYETIKYMAMIRGTPPNRIHADVMKLLQSTDLLKYANVRVKYFSGGTKRKLNTAIAMQSDPWIVFLDEPTTGVDPTSRRFMWRCIQECQKQNKNIVLTSHSMDECEHLCNRLAIMSTGQLKCIGPIQHLKKSFGLGFLIIIIIKSNQSENDVLKVKQTMATSFECLLREEYGNQLSFSVQEENVLWSHVFKKIQSIQKRFITVIDDISVCETALEDIFLKIARDTHQEEIHDSPV